MNQGQEQPEKKSHHLIILDFDGVLGIPYTHPPKIYDGLHDLLTELSKTYLLALASFNPEAYPTLIANKLDHLFCAFRAGHNHNHPAPVAPEYKGPTLGLCKAMQIESILDNELKDTQVSSITFFDDDDYNIELVSTKLSHIKSVKVKTETGFTKKYLSFLDEDNLSRIYCEHDPQEEEGYTLVTFYHRGGRKREERMKAEELKELFDRYLHVTFQKAKKECRVEGCKCYFCNNK